MAEMQLSSNAETLEVNRRRAVIELVNYMRRYLISLINKYKVHIALFIKNWRRSFDFRVDDDHQNAKIREND